MAHGSKDDNYMYVCVHIVLPLSVLRGDVWLSLEHAHVHTHTHTYTQALVHTHALKLGR